MELVRVRTATAPGLAIWLSTLRKCLSHQGHRVEIIDNGPVHMVLQANHPDIHGVHCIDATLQWRGEPGRDETLEQLRDAVAALVPFGQGLSLRTNAATPELVAA